MTVCVHAREHAIIFMCALGYDNMIDVSNAWHAQIYVSSAQSDP